MPSPGVVFFLLAYHGQFRSVRVINRTSVTSLFDKDGESAWLHAMRDAKQGTKQGVAPR